MTTGGEEHKSSDTSKGKKRARTGRLNGWMDMMLLGHCYYIYIYAEALGGCIHPASRRLILFLLFSTLSSLFSFSSYISTHTLHQRIYNNQSHYVHIERPTSISIVPSPRSTKILDTQEEEEKKGQGEHKSHQKEERPISLVELSIDRERN
jgi:hypothetical protein